MLSGAFACRMPPTNRMILPCPMSFTPRDDSKSAHRHALPVSSLDLPLPRRHQSPSCAAVCCAQVLPSKVLTGCVSDDEEDDEEEEEEEEEDEEEEDDDDDE